MADERDPDFQRPLRDPKVSKQYRDLEPLEPPPELDQKILAAAREAAESSHAPLVAPAGRHRWYYSLAAAAVLVFAVALTLHIDRDRRDPEAAPSASVRGEIKQAQKADTVPPAQPAHPEPAPAFAPDPQTSAPSEASAAPPPAPAPRADERPRRRVERAAATTDAMQADAQRRAASEMAATAKEQASAARSLSVAPSAAPVAAAPENPERWLERIAELRSRGRHADADRELAAFRKAYPNYQISNVMRERVEGTPTPSQ